MKTDKFGGAVRDLLGNKMSGFPAPQPGKITQITAAEPNSYGIPVTGMPIQVARAPDSFCQVLWSRLSEQMAGSPEYQSTLGEIDKYCGLPESAKPPKPPAQLKPPTQACQDAKRAFRGARGNPFVDQFKATELMFGVRDACGDEK